MPNVFTPSKRLAPVSLARLASATLLMGASTAAMAQSADRIWTGGPIITMEDEAMRAEAIAEDDGRIIAVGSSAEVMKMKGTQTQVIDLKGRALLPGFVDAHGHVVGGGIQAIGANLLAPPDGTVTDIPSLIAVLRKWAADNKAIVDRYGIIVGFGYDNATLAEARHPTHDELDLISKTVPIYLVHQSGHFGATNSAGLAKMGITRDTPHPPGGIIRKRADGEPDGVLEESAHFSNVGKLFGQLDAQAGLAIIKAGGELWARFGYTTAQEGRATGSAVTLLEAAAAQKLLPIDYVAYIDVFVDRDMALAKASRNYDGRLRVGGAKLTIDGSPQGFTAWRDKPYFDPVGDYPQDWVGYAAVTREQVIDSIDWAYANKVQLLTHSNGEASHDLMIAAFRMAEEKHGAADHRDGVRSRRPQRGLRAGRAVFDRSECLARRDLGRRMGRAQDLDRADLRRIDQSRDRFRRHPRAARHDPGHAQGQLQYRAPVRA